MKLVTRGLVAALAAVALVGTACGTAAPAGPAAGPAAGPGCIPGFDANTDYFPVKAAFDHAENISLTYERSYQVLTIKQPYPGGAPESYVLVRCGAPKPQLTGDLAKAQVITTPVKSIYSESTTQIPMIVESGALDALTGVGTPDFVSTPEVVARIKGGTVKGFEANGQLNAESVITAKPDVLLSQGTENPAFPAIRAAGVPVIGWAEYLDTSPLGQAEWIKVMGALTGHEVDAARVFGEIEKRYTDVAAKAKAAKPVPVVLGSLYQGNWSVPAGGSTAGALFRDAGATWSEAANPGAGTVQKSFESVFAGDGAAAVWLTNGPFPNRAAVLAADARYGELASVKSGQVWTRDKRKGPGGGNEVFERGVTHPDEVLADIVQLLHPELLPGREFVYYQQVPA